MTNRVLWTVREDFMNTAIQRILEVDVILDIGCGIVPHNYITPYIYICCEPYNEYVEVLRKKIKSNTDSIFVVLNYDWETVVNNFREHSVDTVYLLDVIEHLDKTTGERLLRLTEKIASKQIIIFTPLGFVEQKTLHGGKDAWGLDGAEWQEHKSGWVPEDFDESWEIIACKDYHLHNNIGEELEEPFGAFWAIKNTTHSGGSFSTLIDQNDDLLLNIFQQGKHVYQLLKQEKTTLEQKNAVLEQNKMTLEQKNAVLEQNKMTLEQKIASLEKTIEDLQERNTILQSLADELNRLYNTRSWKLLNIAYKIKKKLFN